ncbi:MAG: hypothetical protein IJI60_01375, partial [Bacilli bacterium]|nr:hypothetical protein [Bacilli bacterium]
MNTETMYSGTSLSTSYWYADSAVWGSPTANKYNLVSPYKVSSSSDYPNLVGKYTFRSTSQTYTNTSVYYIAGVSSSTMYYIQLGSGNNLSYYDYTYTFGDGYTDNGNGTYTITNTGGDPVTINRTDWYTSYSDKANKYVCKNATNNTCNEVWYVGAVSSTNFSYAKPADTYKYSKSFTYSNGTYTLNDSEAVSFWDYTSSTNKDKINNA